MRGKRLISVLVVVVLLVGLCACGAKGGDLKTLLTTYTWKFPGSATVFLRPDGTGAQYNKGSGVPKDSFRWELSGNVLHLILTDDGEGMTGEQVEQLNWTINRLTGPSSFGLWNVNQRIRHLYGGEYCMTVESEFGVYTKTRITIPLDGSPSIREPNA